MIRWILPALAFAVVVNGCQPSDSKKLPILGQYSVDNGDTTWHEIPDFRFMNQDSQWVTNATFANGIYVADFFFTSCPSICPVVKKQMLRIHDAYADRTDVQLLSHSIDTKRDSVPVLKLYSTNLGVDASSWHFVTGPRDSIFSIANDYFVTALEDPSAPGGYDHSGRIILVDGSRHIRSFCDGTDPDAVTAFMKDIDLLLDES